MNVITTKLKEVTFSVLPITILVLVLHFSLTPVDTPVLIRFIIGAIFIVIGLTVFLLGVEIGITRIGNIMGSHIAKSNKIWIVVVAGLVLGFIITAAEPDLHILAGQVDSVTAGFIPKLIIVGFVSIGVAVMLTLGLVRTVYNIPLYKLLTPLYLLIFIIALFVSPEFLAISFDASGATTGALTVPFILALAIGVSKLKKDSKSSEKDSFGLVAIASTGAIISVLVMNIMFGTKELAGEQVKQATTTSIFYPFLHELPIIAFEVFIALLPVILIFIIFQIISFKVSAKIVKRILFGVLFTFLGLVIFLTGVNAGFMDVGKTVGYNLAVLDNKIYVVAVGFILGFVTILAEPAVYVLTNQIEDVTSGYVSRKAVMITLSIGVGLAVALSMLRIVIPELKLWHYLLPGYIVSIALMYIVPKLFVGIAFDSGGVASGPMTATFILAYANGAAEAIDGADVLVDGFGMIAMVAMTPIIALQILGFIFKMKSKKGGLKKNG